MAFEAGRFMLDHLKRLAAKRANFAFETTLATKNFAPWVRELKTQGYLFRLMFLWLSSPDEAVERVRHRQRSGGHFVPEDTVRRRYERGLNNFFGLYQPLADVWKFFNNSSPRNPVLNAEGRGTMERVYDMAAWSRIKERSNG
jgi:predicted ABC-type ATPase